MSEMILNEEADSMPLPYSYHTFMYPFSYETDGSGELRLEGWTLEAECTEESVLQPKGPEQEYDPVDIWRYNEYQYYFPKARNNLFNNSHKESVHYSKKIDGIFTIKRTTWRDSPKQEGDFSKTQGIGNPVPETYSLNINNIRLSLYTKQKIGVLTLELEYFPEKELSNKKKFGNACHINDYGRRAFSPSLNHLYKGNGITEKKEITSSYMMADQILLTKRTGPADGSGLGEMLCQVDFPLIGDKGKISFAPELKLVEYLIGNPNVLRDKKSILDDRMYTVCLIRDDWFTRKGVHELMGKSMLTPSERRAIDESYRFVFLDAEDTSCHSRRMLQEKLQNHLYDRWADWGTFHGVTEYSFVCATGESPVVLNSVINPFLAIYVDMAKLALVQRAELTRLEEKISDRVKEFHQDQARITQKEIDAINVLWKEFVIFQNEVYLPEVTFQEQGVELYDLLKRHLRLDVLIKRLDNSMNNLRDLAQMAENALQLDETKKEKESSDRLNRTLNLFAVIGCTIGLFGITQDFFGTVFSVPSENVQWCSISFWYAAAFLLLGLISGWFSHVLNNKAADPEEKRTIRTSIREGWGGILLWILVAVLVFGVYYLFSIL